MEHKGGLRMNGKLTENKQRMIGTWKWTENDGKWTYNKQRMDGTWKWAENEWQMDRE